MFRQIGPTELLVILLIIVLLFGAKKLPELARGSGRALRIFKSETKGLIDDDDDEESTKTPEQREIEARNAQEAQRRATAEQTGTTQPRD